ncbi:IscS subfamily cysteine desulfurase [Mangrovimicrobium sediminis]|uniref:Cysteine desulfurase IscS n=1 Tax=Mangrovimicrobium sediminis TaxID=2562682 RepID=A0A4Z0M354_9GAMM|nr:IscS subfamily cysteine desulfurase [Haliea sp. SAOS-164]TGD73941.1 IscS subfamily cysteine desulfurase [Haliea sp. SAOS-164]
MQKPIYFDYQATTPADPRVVEKMVECLSIEGNFGNPASRSHLYGWKAEEAVENARRQVADLIGADPREIVWTSGATESDNLAIKGVAHFYQKKGKHIITSKIEHKAVLDTCRHLEREGFEVTYLDPDEHGLTSPEAVKAALREDTILVSIMHANNEIGTVNDIAGIGKVTREAGVLLHTDAAQSAGKIPVDVEALNVDLMSLSAHKMYGPKGIGALYVRRKPRVRIEAQMHGGGHERGMRSGTLATHQIVGMGEAARIAREEMPADAERSRALRDRFLAGIADIEEVHINGDLAHHLPGAVNISIAFVEGESLIMSLKDLAISSGSACTSASLEPSYVLRALGLDDELAHSSLRFSFGRFTSEEDVDHAVEQLRGAVTKLRELSPLWDMHQDGIDLSTIEWAAH